MPKSLSHKRSKNQKRPKRSKRSKRSMKQRSKRLLRGGSDKLAALEESLRLAKLKLSARGSNLDRNPYDAVIRAEKNSLQREVQSLQSQIDQARRVVQQQPYPLPPAYQALQPKPLPPGYQALQPYPLPPAYKALQPKPQPMAPIQPPQRPPPQPMAPIQPPQRPPQPMAPIRPLYQPAPQPPQLYGSQNNYNKRLANAAAIAAAKNSLMILQKRVEEEVQRLAADLEKKKMIADQSQTNTSRLWVDDAKRRLESAKTELLRVKNAQLNPTGTNAVLLLATGMKTQNNVRGRLLAQLSSKSKVPKKNLMQYTMKDLLKYLGS